VTKKAPTRSSKLTQQAAKAFTRRTLLRYAAATTAVASVAPFVIGAEARAASGTINIMMWSDYLPKPFRNKFTKETGIKIKHTPYGSNEELINKIKATRGRGFDLISPTNDRTGQWQDLNLLQTFDMNRVPTDNVIDSMLRISAGF